MIIGHFKVSFIWQPCPTVKQKTTKNKSYYAGKRERKNDIWNIYACSNSIYKASVLSSFLSKGKIKFHFLKNFHSPKEFNFSSSLSNDEWEKERKVSATHFERERGCFEGKRERTDLFFQRPHISLALRLAFSHTPASYTWQAFTTFLFRFRRGGERVKAFLLFSLFSLFLSFALSHFSRRVRLSSKLELEKFWCKAAARVLVL